MVRLFANKVMVTKDVAWSVFYSDSNVGYIGIVEKKMETTIMGCIGVMYLGP